MATRLRKTFKYPDDSDGSDVSRDELDEEGMDTLPGDHQDPTDLFKSKNNSSQTSAPKKPQTMRTTT